MAYYDGLRGMKFYSYYTQTQKDKKIKKPKNNTPNTTLYFRTTLKFVMVLILIYMLLPSCFAAEDMHQFKTKPDELRYQTLIQQTRCVVCQGQNIADSNAPLAHDLREKIYQMVTAQETDEEIKAYLTKRYGEFILYQPRFNQFTYFLWAFPFIGLFLIFTYFVLFKRYRSLS